MPNAAISPRSDCLRGTPIKKTGKKNEKAEKNKHPTNYNSRCNTNGRKTGTRCSGFVFFFFFSQLL